MATTTTINPAKKYYDEANQAIDEQAILDKYNAATTAQFNVQREQNRQAENKFYNQMYNTQKTAMDTIRQSNANAVSSGASRGVQAANELSALLGLQSESVTSATELAQANRQTAQEETAAVIDNILKAYQQAQQEKAQMVQHGIEAASVEAQRETTQATQANTVTQAAENGTMTYLAALQGAGIDLTTYSDANEVSLSTALNAIGKTTDGEAISFKASDWKDTANPAAKGMAIENNIRAICTAYGIPYEGDIQTKTEALRELAGLNVSFLGSSEGDKPLFAKFGIGNGHGKTDYASKMNEAYAQLKNEILNMYYAKRITE